MSASNRMLVVLLFTMAVTGIAWSIDSVIPMGIVGGAIGAFYQHLYLWVRAGDKDTTHSQ